MSEVTGPKPILKSLRPTDSNKCSGVKPTHLSIGYPQAEFCPLNPRSYSCGFSRDGRIIGSNLPVPYPRDHPWYHDIPFRRTVDWYAPAITRDKGHGKKEEKQPSEFVDGCERCRLEHATAHSNSGGRVSSKQGCCRHEIKIVQGQGEKAENDGHEEDEQDVTVRYVVEDDPKFKAWVDEKVAAQREREKIQRAIRQVPWEIKLSPGHYAPSVLQTTNETYGQHLDMLPKSPLVYPEVEVKHKYLPLLVRYRRSNMSDHPPIPDHSFAVDRSEMETLDGAPLRGLMGAPFKPEWNTRPEALTSDRDDLKSPAKAKSKQKIPTTTPCCRGTTFARGSGIKPPAPGFLVKDPWTFRRSAIVLGQVIGERELGCTWPMYTPTGLELNHPIQRYVCMTSGHPNSGEICL